MLIVQHVIREILEDIRELLLASLGYIFPLAPEDVLPIDLPLESGRTVEVVPELNVEAEVDMEVLVMVVVEDTVRLPGLPPLFL